MCSALQCASILQLKQLCLSANLQARGRDFQQTYMEKMQGKSCIIWTIKLGSN